MSAIRRLTLCVVFGFAAVACGGDDTSSEPSVASEGSRASPDTTEATPASPDTTEVTPASPDTTEATPSPPDTSEAAPAPSELSEMLFDQTVVHEIAMEITDENLALLDPPSDDRVPVVLTVDGQTADGAGVRLKQGFAQFQGMDAKPGFSIETDEFVDGLVLFDVDRFTLGNSTWDHSFAAEQLVYELYRAAGVPAARTALARVTVNGETYGLYVMRETYDERWLEQYFSDPTGNLYESEGGGSETKLELRTNEKQDDTSDLAEVADVVATVPDEDYRTTIEQLVDVDQLLTYWAIEALTAHWDGYVYDLSPPERVPAAVQPLANPYPNNFYLYHDPATDLFVFIPHGADLSFGLGAWNTYDVVPSTPALFPPKEYATIAARLWNDPAFRDELAQRMQWVIDEIWDVQALTARVDMLADLVRADGLVGSREFVTLDQFERAVADRTDFLTRRPEEVRAELAGSVPVGQQGDGG